MWSYTSTDNQWKDINVCRKDKWNAFLGQYEVYDIAISTSKFSIIIDNIMIIDILRPPSYWYSLSDNCIGGLYELFRLE